MAVVTVDELRAHLMDQSEFNLPLGIQYLEDEDLDDCIAHTVDDFNSTPPILRSRLYTVDDFPFKTLLLQGAMVEALERTRMRELRGEMQYSDGGVQNALWYKTPQFTAIKSEMEAKYERGKGRIKRQLNLEAGFGGSY